MCCYSNHFLYNFKLLYLDMLCSNNYKLQGEQTFITVTSQNRPELLPCLLVKGAQVAKIDTV